MRPRRSFGSTWPACDPAGRRAGLEQLSEAVDGRRGLSLRRFAFLGAPGAAQGNTVLKADVLVEGDKINAITSDATDAGFDPEVDAEGCLRVTGRYRPAPATWRYHHRKRSGPRQSERLAHKDLYGKLRWAQTTDQRLHQLQRGKLSMRQ